MNYIEELRNELWQQAIGTKNRVIDRANCEWITQQILILTGKKIHWETIRNFFQEETEPSPQTLSKISAFVLKDQNATYQHFIENFNKSDKTPEKKPDIIHKAREFPKKAIALVVAFISLIVLFFVVRKPWVDKGFEEHFDDVSMENLQKNGWSSFDVHDSYWWEKRNVKKGHLTLYTLEGDYWRNSFRIPNILIKEIKLKNFSITVEIDSFNPLKPFQQAGFILLGKKLSPQNILRMTVAYSTPSPKVKNPELDNQWVHTLVVKNGEPIEPGVRGIRHPEANNIPLPQSIALRMEIDRQKEVCFFLMRTNIGAFLPIASVDITGFEPKYIGLVAFQGQHENGTVPIIPASFKRVTVEPLF